MKTAHKRNALAVMLSCALGPVLVLPALAQDVEIDPKNVTIGKTEYSPYLTKGYPDRVYFGDTHLHTSYSTDVNRLPNLTPDRRPILTLLNDGFGR